MGQLLGDFAALWHLFHPRPYFPPSQSRARRVISVGRQNGELHLGLLPSKGQEERGDLIDFLVTQLGSQLYVPHDVYRILQTPDLTRVEIGGGEFNVT